MPKSAEDLGLPAGAVFEAGLGAWEVAERDPEGERDGESRLYREDGSLKVRCRYSHGTLSGPFQTFHPDGALARTGSYVDGELDGLVTAYSSDVPGADCLRPCCVPPGATELRTRYRNGSTLREIFYDSAGRPLRADGTPWPERPPGLADHADFDELSGRWFVHTRTTPEGDAGMTRYFATDGSCSEEIELISGRKRGSRRFDAQGTLLEQKTFDETGALSGPFYRRYIDPPFEDARIVAEAGTMQGSAQCGEARFFDAAGEVVRSLHRGAPLSESELRASPVLADAAELGAEFAESLAKSGRAREALLANARCLGRDRDRARFEALHDRVVIARKPASRAEHADAAETLQPQTAVAALEALLLGGEPSRLLRLLASLLPWPSRAALELVEAALLLDPASSRGRVTRALLRFEDGDVNGALEDAEMVARESPDAARSLREFRRVVFPEFTFWPARDAVTSSSAELAELRVSQPLAAIRRAVQVYATRLGLVRDALLARVKASEPTSPPEWLPPDTRFLLPDGPVELKTERATIEDETDDGVETSEVTIDERVVTRGLGVPGLMRVARADWASLCWLCWSVGLDRVAVPEALAEEPRFGAAVDRATSRCFRAHDQLRLGGMVSAVRGVPDFTWEGLTASELPTSLNEVAAQELLEVRALFFWLLFEQNVSPFQSDLRQV